MTDRTILVLPGGGYRRHAPHEAEPIAEWLGSLGWRTEIVRYPVGVRHPAPLDAVRAALARRRAQGDRTVGVIGFSAGGHLAGLAALWPHSDPAQRPDFAILSHPVTSMITAPHVASRAILVGDDDALAAQTSLERLVTSAAPPMFVWHTVHDAAVPVAHTYRLAAALADAGVLHEVHTFAGDVHGVGLGEGTDAAPWTALCATWLARRG